MSGFLQPWTVACQAPLFMDFSRQEHWSRLPRPSPGDLPDPGIEPESPELAGRFFTAEPPRKPVGMVTHMIKLHTHTIHTHPHRVHVKLVKSE